MVCTFLSLFFFQNYIFEIHPCLLCVSVVSVFMVKRVPLWKYTPICLSVGQLMGFWVVSTLETL